MATIVEIETKRTNLSAKLEELKLRLPTLTIDTDDYDKVSSEYLAVKSQIAAIPGEIAAVKVVENKAQIDVAGAAISEAIEKMIEGSKVADLIGKPVISLNYFRTASKDASGNETIVRGVVFNPHDVVSKKSAASNKTADNTKRDVIKLADGTTLSKTKFVEKYAADADFNPDGKLSADEVTSKKKYPHVLVDSQPKFDAFVVRHAELAGATLVKGS